MTTRLIPPLVKDTNVRRPTLVKKISQITSHPLSIIHSGPGYGKSTTLSSFLKDSHYSFCWYSLSKQDDDFLPFVIHLLYAFRKQEPSFAQELLDYMMTEEPYTYDEDIQFICTEFINELAGLQGSIILVLDDFHVIEQTDSIKKWMMTFIQHLPPHVHLVLSGRVRPDWEILVPLQVKGELLEVTEQDLAFSPEEIDVLFSDYYEMPLDDRQIHAIFQLTEGWIIAIQMIWQQLKNNGTIDSFLFKNPSSMEELFRFIAMEVFSKQPKLIQSFLEQTSILEELSEHLCNELLQIEGSGKMLEKLIQQNLFIVPIGDGHYRYHALFRDFLQTQLKQKPEEYKMVQKHAAKYFMEQQDNERAITHLIALQDYEQLGRMLHFYGKEMLESGKIESLLELLQLIPEQMKDRNFMLWFYEGEISRYRCHYKTATYCFERTIKQAERMRNPLGESAGYEGIAKVYLDTIQPGNAAPYLSKAIELMEQSKNAELSKKIQMYTLMAENMVNLGQMEAAEEWYKKSKKIFATDQSIEEFQKIELEARLYLRTGRLQKAKEVLEQSRNRSLSENHLSRSHRETDLLLSIINAYMGEAESAKKLAEAGILQGSKRKAPFVEACGWIRIGHSVQLIERYNRQLAIECYQTALGMMEELKMNRGKAEPLMGLCLLYGRTGDYELAIENGNQALEETEKVKDVWLSSYIRLSMGIASYYEGLHEEAETLFTDSLENFKSCSCSYGITVTNFWLALVCYEKGEVETFQKYISDFLENAYKGKYEFFVTKRTAFGPTDIQSLIPVLLEAKKQGINIKRVQPLLEQMGVEDLTFHPGYTLRVNTLGEFRVWLGNKEVEQGDWKREKAKELFQVFITRFKKWIPKSELLNLLWKDLDEETATRDFKVALNALNKVLEPERKARTAPFFIERQGSTYGLNRSAGIEVDARRFEQLIEEGLSEPETHRSIKKLTIGLELYKGDYLPNRRYEDWCIEERERLMVLFLRGAEYLAQLKVKEEKFDEAIHWCNEILARDACWEEAYRLLMYCYYRKNNRPYALKVYEKCMNKLMEEMGVEPLDTTKRMAYMIQEAAELELL
ncbi:transcriptional regulator [Pseudalkalibacillus caeni]|uniref:Transcriptional regulator n=2 Tax=Exobacillus caeni TaxID=2574798 RepID=A0A5R9F757_9BACL|nr:transcriptional regulator [Pseudalkalibacillus caeni]